MLKTIWKAAKFLIAAVLIFGLFGGIYAWQFHILPGLIKAGVESAPPPVETIAAEKARADLWPPYVRAIGTAKAYNGVDVAPQVGGVVQSLFFASGDRVEKGAKLVQLDSDTELADLKSLEATLANADRDLSRKDALAKKGYGSKSDQDSAQAKMDETLAGIEKVRALIAKKTVVAPFSGDLGIRKVDPGQYVQPGAPLVWLQTLDPIYVDFDVPEASYARMKAGQEVQLTAGAYPGETFKGTVDTIDARMAADTRTMMVRAKLANRDRRLVPGMFVNVSVIQGAPEPVVTLPETAITYSLYGDSIYVIKPAAAGADATTPRDVERRFVKVGEAREGRVSILDGLKPDEEVVTVGQLKLNPGTKVLINNEVVLDTGGLRKTE